MSEPEQYFRGKDLDKAIEWIKQYKDKSDIGIEVEGTITDTGEHVSFKGKVLDVESGILRKEKIIVRLSRKPSWLNERIVSIGKPKSSKKDADIAADEIYLKLRPRRTSTRRRYYRRRRPYY